MPEELRSFPQSTKLACRELYLEEDQHLEEDGNCQQLKKHQSFDFLISLIFLFFTIFPSPTLPILASFSLFNLPINSFLSASFVSKSDWKSSAKTVRQFLWNIWQPPTVPKPSQVEKDKHKCKLIPAINSFFLWLYEGAHSVSDILMSVIIYKCLLTSGTIQTLTMTMAALIITTINTMATPITTTTTTTSGSNLSKEISSCVHLQISKEISSCVHLQISKEISSSHVHLRIFTAPVQRLCHLLQAASFSAFSFCLSAAQI